MTRFENVLLPTLLRHAHAVSTLWVITPDAVAGELADRFEGTGRVRLVPETAVLPALVPLRSAIAGVGTETGAGPGWFVQQMLKLAAARIVSSPFYLTLDADVLCVRDLHYDDLIRGNRAPVVVHYHDVHAGWYWWAERVLGYSRPLNHGGRTHGVTPAVLSVEAVEALLRFLVERWADPSAIGELADDPVGIAMVRALPWTEYTLYYLFLEHEGLFDRYHYVSEHELYGNCVWSSENFAEWDPASSFIGARTFWFSVVQSNTGVPPAAVLERIRPYL